MSDDSKGTTEREVRVIADRQFAEAIVSSLIPASGTPEEVCGYLWDAIGLIARAHPEVKETMQRTILKFVERLKTMNSEKTTAQSDNAPPLVWPDPTPEMLASPEFMAVWEAIKTWDVAVPGAYAGYCGATGNHVRAILDTIRGRRLNIVPYPLTSGVQNWSDADA